VLHLYNNKIDTVSFLDSATEIIFHGFSSAWYQGAKSVGIQPDELTDAEKQAMQVAIYQQLIYLPGFADYVYHNSRLMNDSLPAVLNRMSMWIIRWNQFVNQGRMMARLDQKLKWVRGPTSDSCDDCKRLDGRVYRASTWLKYDIRPQSHRLKCKGFKCLCGLYATTDRCNPGRPPGIG
jgi:hypothetical protein